MTSVPTLSAEEQRLLGCLLEKERTVPASYPLSLNGLRTACNQTSSREPVVDYDERLVEQTARGLKDRGLVRVVWADSGRRTLKYHQTLAEVLELAEDERALLTVLLLRGPQAAGELRTRTERLNPFPDRSDVEATLARMAAADPPLVVELPRRSGERDPRWAHLLGEEPPAPSAPAAEVPVRLDLTTRDDRVRSGYGAVAEQYAEQLVDELDGLPFERWLLDRVALEAPGPVVEVGCGPGHVTAYLADQGVEASGLDLTPAMVQQAAARFPQASYAVGDLRTLMRPPHHDGWGAVLAWYSLIHLTDAELGAALGALVRPLTAGGLLVVGLHAGSGVRHLGEWFGAEVDLDVVLHEPEHVARLVEQAGLVDVEWYRRGALAGRGETTQRGYVVGHRPV